MKYLILISFLFSASVCFSQPVTQRSSDVITVMDGNLFAKNSFRPAVFQDTTAGTIGLDSCGKLIFTYSDNSYWIRACSPKRWIRLLKTGDLANTAWGSITGTLSNQTDLQNALNLKFNISDTTNKWVQSVYARNDSLFKQKNDIETFTGFLNGGTANNGILKTANNYQLGSPLIQNTTIAGGAFGLSLTGTGSVTTLSITNSGTSNGMFINTFAGTGSAISAQSNNATTISAFSFGSGYGASIGSTSNIGLYAFTTSGVSGLAVDVNPSSTNTSQTTLQLKRYTSGTAGNNIAGRIEFITEPSSGTVDVTSGYIESGWEDATFATRKSFMGLHTVLNGTASKVLNLASNGQLSLPLYPSLTAQVDTTIYKPVAIDGSGNVVKMAGWAGSGGGGGAILNNIGTGYAWAATPGGNIKRVGASNTILWDSTSTANTLTAKADTSVLATQYDLTQFASSTTLTSDIPHLSQIKIYSPAQGTNASRSLSNYNFASVDSARYKFSTTRAGTSGSEYGGWLVPAASGDSVQVTAPFWVIFGDSQAEGHPGLHGREHPLVAGAVQNTFIYNYPDSIGQLSYHLRTLTNMRWYNQGIGGQTTVNCRQRFYRDVLGVNSPNSTDGRTDQTLSRKPQGVVIIVGVNDIFTGIPAQTTKDNLEWMASQCQQNDMRCVILNMPGDAIATQSQLQLVASMNKWLSSGVMDQYGASVVDYNAWWNNPAYGYDNIHPTALIVDDIHPSKVGYDSLASYIYRRALLPVLRRAVFINELSPTTPITYARPSSITINSSPYSLSSLNDTIGITTFVSDSVWIKIAASVPFTGTDSTGFSHIEWLSDNNPLDSLFYTRKTLYSGSQKANMNGSALTMFAPTLQNGYEMLRGYLGDMTTTGLLVRTYAATARVIINGTTELNSAALSINGPATSIGTSGNIIIGGTSSQIGPLQFLQNSTAGTSGFGISTANTASSISIQATPQAGKDILRVTTYNGAASNLGSAPVNLLNITGAGFANSTGINQVGHGISLTPIINNTVGDAGGEVTGIYYSPIRTSLTNTRHVGIFQRSGNNYFNVFGTDSTCFGCDSASNILAKFRVNGSGRFDLGIIGTATNDNAVAGNIGEEVNSIISTYTNYTATATYQNVTSITLTAGDWDLSAFFTYSSNSATITAAANAVFVISTTTASAAGATEGKNISYIPQAALLGTSLFSDAIAPYRVSIAGTTTYYLNTQAAFTLGNPQYTGTIRARRVR